MHSYVYACSYMRTGMMDKGLEGRIYITFPRGSL